ncbi:MAG: hypothetical protein AAFX09_06730 [Pseudomonadota bacterium]
MSARTNRRLGVWTVIMIAIVAGLASAGVFGAPAGAAAVQLDEARR